MGGKERERMSRMSGMSRMRRENKGVMNPSFADCAQKTAGADCTYPLQVASNHYNPPT